MKIKKIIHLLFWCHLIAPFPLIYSIRHSITNSIPTVDHKSFFHPSISPFGTSNNEDLENLVPYSNSLYATAVARMDEYMDSGSNPSDVIFNFVERLTLNLQSRLSFIVKNTYSTLHNSVTHGYLKQTYCGLEIVNADMNINVADNGRVLSFSSSFFHLQGSSQYRCPHPNTLRTTPLDALNKLIQYIEEQTHDVFPDYKFLPNNQTVFEVAMIITNEEYASSSSEVGVSISVPFSKSPVKSRLAYIQTQNGVRLQLVWDIILELEENWINAFIAADDTLELLGLIDWFSDIDGQSSYMIYPTDPDGSSASIRMGPLNKKASPFGWHNQQGMNDESEKNFDSTIGNNVYAQYNEDGAYDYKNDWRPDGGPDHKFLFSYNLAKDPQYSTAASVTNLFYWNNWMHDLFEAYGFDEASGNFQMTNYGKLGRGSDPVIAMAQDGSGMNNANFATPPDGQSGRMRMYVWSMTEPYRDGDMDSGIIIHEYGHGVSTRLTGRTIITSSNNNSLTCLHNICPMEFVRLGGPANSNCLKTGESGGLGEGWGDFWATILHMNSSSDCRGSFGMGSYVNGGQNIRTYPYTMDMSINPTTYGNIKLASYYDVHAKGEIWAQILFDVFCISVLEGSFDRDWVNGNGTNNQILSNVVDALKLQPCRPTFLDARDAILEAEQINHNGILLCPMWKGFAKRGLGVLAKGRGMEDFSAPSQCAPN